MKSGFERSGYMADNEKQVDDKRPTTSEGGKITDRDAQPNEGNANTIDKHAQGNLGGRNPSQPQTSMGDRDPKGQNRGQPDITEPMTSRDPSKINQKPQQGGGK
jgi:hypothetical protein